ncbi:ABC transporter ATP-binding protein [Micromonospora cathayae]|uniref:ABC transporter ATP-binding protein n=1 Tax=Micromonospora cathayae TaxID=3028804 RepID=A0ABY7ZXK6_9ACTN|nr:ABC transporter ATP-binding protein [Micromonospora sp. HUAS 3]WDZ86609.1 ABC transporter ATP-binding protein [Micromonospora sp. HUAS 3]
MSTLTAPALITSETRETPAPDTRVAGFPDAFALLRPYRMNIAVALVLGVAATGVAAAQPLLVASTVDSLRGGIPRDSVVALFALLVASAVLQGLQQLVLQRSAEKLAFDTRERLIRHIYRLPIAVLERRDRGDLVSRITTDVSHTRAILSSGLVELAVSVVAVIISLVMMALIDPVLLGLAVLAVITVIGVLVLIGSRTRPSGLRLQNAVGNLASVMSRALGAMRTIRSTVSTGREAHTAVRYAATALDAGLQVARLRAVIQTFTGMAVQLLLIAVVAAGALRVASGALTVGDLSAFLMYLLLMAAPITMFGGVLSMLGEAFGALTRIKAIEALEPEQDAPAAAVREPLPGAPVFALREVSFRYQGRTTGSDRAPGLALDKITLDFPTGRTTAIVGPSGAGKSTLFALLERFYDPSGGTILHHGHDVRKLPRDHLRSRIAYVEQDAPALSGTIRENLLLGAHDAADDRCLDALRRVNLLPADGSADDFLDAEVGEVGALLSGGERQRLAIARAFLAGSPVLLLDEVTSNLDSTNERVVQDVVKATDGRQTAIVIAHRLSTVVAADLIVVMDQGRVVAQGTHRELLDSCPLYRELAHHQLLD